MKLAVFCMHRFFFSSILRIDNLISRMHKMVLMLQCCLSPQKGFSVCHPRCIEGEQSHALEKDGGSGISRNVYMQNLYPQQRACIKIGKGQV